MGTSPMDVKVPKGNAAVIVEARHAGYMVAKGNVVPSSDQRLKLTLIPVRPAASGSAKKPD